MRGFYEDRLFFAVRCSMPGTWETDRSLTWNTAPLLRARAARNAVLHRAPRGYAQARSASLPTSARRDRRMPTLNETFSVSNADSAWNAISDLNKLIPLVP